MAKGYRRSQESRAFITQNLIALLNEIDNTMSQRSAGSPTRSSTKALEGDVTAINSVMDRVDGKVPQPIAGDPDNPLTISTVVHEIVRVEAANQRSNPPIIDARDPKAA